MADLTLEKPAGVTAANDASKAVDMPLHKRAVALHSQILDLVSPVPDADDRRSSCSRLTCHAISLLDQSDMTDNDPWLEALRDVEAMIRGALGCRDGTAEQQTALASALAILWPLQMLLDGGNGGKPPTTAIAAEAGAEGDGSLLINHERRMLGLEACWLIQPMCDTAAKLLDDFKMSDMAEVSRLSVIIDMLRRAGRLVGVPMSVLDDDDDVGGLTRRLEGVAP